MVAMHLFLTQLPLYTPGLAQHDDETSDNREIKIGSDHDRAALHCGSKKISPAAADEQPGKPEAKEESGNPGNRVTHKQLLETVPPLLCLVSVLHCGEISNVVPCAG